MHVASVAWTPVVILAWACLACGGTVKTEDALDSSPDSPANGDVATDVATSVDATPSEAAPNDTGIACGAAICRGADECCSFGDGGATLRCAASCDGGVRAACAGPGECGGRPCCTQFSFAGPPAFSTATCTVDPTDCVSAMTSSNGGQTRACHVDADCTSGAISTQFTRCCTFKTGGTDTYRACVADWIVQSSGGAVTCP
jgi:hypothetical protein